jgi:ABC-type phosphate transport system substrate-binding protein
MLIPAIVPRANQLFTGRRVFSRSEAFRRGSTTCITVATITLTLGLSTGPSSADVVAVVSSKSSVISLSKSEVIDIFLGKRTRFPDGNSAVPIDQVEGSAARDEFYSRFVSMSAAQLKAFWSKIIFTGRGQPPTAVGTSLDTKKLLLTNPNAIGYIDQSLVDSSLRVVLAL